MQKDSLLVQGLIPAMKELLPSVPHRFCVWHLWRNFSKQWGSIELKDLVWECARSRTLVEFERNMTRIKRINQQAWDYLAKWPKEAWTKVHFSEEPKVDNICNNACESFNAKTKHERGKPILSLAEEVQRIVMKSMTVNRLKLMNYQGILTPVQQSRLESLIKLSRNWAPRWYGDAKEVLYEVQGWPTNMVVDLGMSCMHAISAIQEKNDKRHEEYCHEWLTIEAYRRTYQYNVNPVKGQELWEKTGSPAPVPPPIKPKPGRPTTKRMKDKAERPTGTKTKMKRKYNPIWCMYCGELGYNKRTCSKKKQDDAQEKARLMQLQLAVVPPPQGAPGPKADGVADTQSIQTLPAVPSAAPDEQTEIPVSQDAQLLLTQQSHTSTIAT
ncbi:uncharacterized protein [Arachis hypogaea]|uniref:uncharacterized protein n=1 Tax=Arachis hypogaea TaxID=3818 RepID=UPI0007AF4CAF